MRRTEALSGNGGFLTWAQRVLHANLVLLSNTVAVSAGSALTAIAGFAYWWVAARHFDPDAVGTASAVISIMGLIGLLGDFGLGTLLLSAALNGERGQGLISAAVTASLAVSVVLAASYLTVAEVIPSINRGLDGFGINDALLIAGCALQGTTLVVDHALIAQLQGKLQFLRNATCAVLKLLLLQSFTVCLPDADGSTLLLSSWVIGLATAMGVVLVVARRRGTIVLGRPDFPGLLPQIPRVLDHHALNMASQAPAILFPFLVAVVFSPAVSAAFYPAWAMVHAASLFTAALTMVLYRLGSVDPNRMKEQMAVSMLLSAVFSCTTAAALFLLSPSLLAFFNPAYPELAGPSLSLLGFGLISISIRQHYLVLMRVQGQMRAASARFAVWGILEISCACAGAVFMGVQGFVLGWLLSISLQSATMLRPLFVASHLHDGWARRHGRG